MTSTAVGAVARVTREVRRERGRILQRRMRARRQSGESDSFPMM